LCGQGHGHIPIGRLERERYTAAGARRGGATLPQGPTQALRWVTIFISDGASIARRSAVYEHERETVFSDVTVNAAGSFAIAPLSIEAICGARDPVTDTFFPRCLLRSTAVLDSVSVVDIMLSFFIVSIAISFFVEGSFIEFAPMPPVAATT
jgi:hypothetical protein